MLLIKGKKIVRNILIVMLLAVILINRAGLYLSPLEAHESSERSIHYGPSEVVHVESFKGGKYILGKYDKWISCNTVNRELLLFWRFGNQVTGVENDKSQAMIYRWGMSDENVKVYGIINDKQIIKIEITLVNGDTIEGAEFYDDMFLFTWDNEDGQKKLLKKIVGYDSNNNVLFEDESLY